MKRILVALALGAIAMSCNSGGGGGDNGGNNNNNNNQCTTNCTQTPPTDLLTESIDVPGTTGWTKEKDLADTENGGQFGAGCEADAQGNIQSKLQIHPGLTVGTKYNVIDKMFKEGNPFAGRVDSDEITGINGIANEINHRLHEVQVKGYDPQTTDLDIVCKINNGQEACAQATRLAALVKEPRKFNMDRILNFKLTNSTGRVQSCSIGGTVTTPITRQVGKLKLRNAATVTAYRMELNHEGDVTCDNQNLGKGKVTLIRFVTNDLPSPVFDYCGGLPAFDYAKLYIGARTLQQYSTEFYSAN
ncbi:MAG: hypothetical protein ABL958_05340 [Bdellovibrionia bacterium]